MNSEKKSASLPEPLAQVHANFQARKAFYLGLFRLVLDPPIPIDNSVDQPDAHLGFEAVATDSERPPEPSADPEGSTHGEPES